MLQCSAPGWEVVIQHLPSAITTAAILRSQVFSIPQSEPRATADAVGCAQLVRRESIIEHHFAEIQASSG